MERYPKAIISKETPNAEPLLLVDVATAAREVSEPPSVVLVALFTLALPDPEAVSFAEDPVALAVLDELLLLLLLVLVSAETLGQAMMQFFTVVWEAESAVKSLG